MSMLKEIPRLLEEGIIDQDTANNIEAYYESQAVKSTNRLFIVFGILGGLLIGLGIILIFAHNWDNLSRGVKSALAISPLIIGQIICGYVILKKYSSPTWCEGSATFLIFAVGASLALISQIYNIPGDIKSFLLTWLLLGLPLVYLMKSSVASLLFLAGLTYYTALTHYWSFPQSESLIYWLLLLIVLPHYYNLLKKQPRSNFTLLHNWAIPLSITAVLGTLVKNHEELIFLAYMSLFGLFYAIGNFSIFKEQKIINNGFKVVGAMTTLGLLLLLSSFGFWEDMVRFSWLENVFIAPEFYTAIILTGLAIYLYFLQQKDTNFEDHISIGSMFLFFIPIFLLGFWSPVSTIFINLLLLLLGVITIRKGNKQDHLGIINLGLLIITALIFARFFDTNISFIVRGLLFVLIGIGFFIANYKMLQKRKYHA